MRFVRGVRQPDWRWRLTITHWGRLVIRMAEKAYCSPGIWHEKITADHPELAGQEQAVIATVEHPDHVEPDVLPSRTRFFAARARPVAGCWWS
jgi:hypothetical protein